MAYLDKTGLTELWKKVKSYVDANAGGTPTTITGNAGSATKLQTTRAIDGVNFNGTADIAHYAVCSLHRMCFRRTSPDFPFTGKTPANLNTSQVQFYVICFWRMRSTVLHRKHSLHFWK